MPGRLVLSPHPDDAVLSCWHALAGRQAEVVTVFAGLPTAGVPLSAWDRLTGASDARARAAVRRAEDVAALTVAGCAVRPLDLLGKSYREGPLDTAALRAAVEAAIGNAEEVWLPAAIGGHPDHRALRDAALDVLGSRTGRMYADLPYAIRYGWPDWVTGSPREDPLDVTAWLAAQLPPAAGGPLVHRLPSGQQARKWSAVRRYASQFPALADRAVLPYEVCWPVTGG